MEELKQQFAEIIDVHLQNESAEMVVVTIRKSYSGQAKVLMEGIWSRFAENKFVIICDEDVSSQDWNDIIWAVTTRMDPSRDTLFVSHQSEPSRMGLDATNKIEGECSREWGIPIKKDPKVVDKIDSIWDELGIL
ncbi:hypothetical protein [Vibrio profundi]|uniref:hypothetical protein n=1 Tax=Vibrio profundi TaxID=1774960 RepID=UPI0037357DCC